MCFIRSHLEKCVLFATHLSRRDLMKRIFFKRLASRDPMKHIFLAAVERKMCFIRSPLNKCVFLPMHFSFVI